MISVALALSFIILRSVQAHPVGASSKGEILADSPGPPHLRTKSAIVWSCLTTVFACTWLALHPNIPKPNATWSTTLLRRLRLMVVALIAPECVILWALHQWIVAYKLGYKYRSYGWTQSHGSFTIMGGFMTYEGDNIGHTVREDELDELLSKGLIKITEEEIVDKSKGNSLSKTIVLIQTTWFILQCIARKINHLPITELELVTLAFATLNFSTYALWWNKPQDVECPIRVYTDQPPQDDEDADKAERKPRGQGKNLQIWYMIIEDARATVTKVPRQISDGLGAISATLQKHWSKSSWLEIALYTLAALFSPIWIPFFALRYVLYIMFRLANQNNLDGGANDLPSLPTFYSGEDLTDIERMASLALLSVIAAIFGAIHCVAWSFEFPSHVEQLLWRISSVTITASMPLVFLIYVFDKANSIDWIDTLLGYLALLVVVPYVISRLILLVLPFCALRALAPEVYQTVPWTTYIPHI